MQPRPGKVAQAAATHGLAAARFPGRGSACLAWWCQALPILLWKSRRAPAASLGRLNQGQLLPCDKSMSS